MFENFILTSKKNKSQEFYAALSKKFPTLNKQDFLDYMWLAEHSAAHNTDNLSIVCEDVLWPMIKGDYIIERENGKPIGYASWGFFSNSVGREKLALHNAVLTENDYDSGKEIWLLDVIAPFGHVKLMIKKLLERKNALGYSTVEINFRRWYATKNKERVNKVEL